MSPLKVPSERAVLTGEGVFARVCFGNVLQISLVLQHLFSIMVGVLVGEVLCYVVSVRVQYPFWTV